MISSSKLVLSGALLALSLSNVSAEILKPFVLGSKTTGDIQSVANDVKSKVTGAGFEIVGTHSPYDGATIISFTSDDLKKSAASSEMGGYTAGQRVSVTKVGDEIQIAYSNPVYYSNIYRNTDISGAAAALSKLNAALGNTEVFGTGKKKLDPSDLKKYHYMFGMEYFDDPSELASYDSYKEAVDAVEKGLAAGSGGTSKVYRIDIPGKDETVFGVAMTEGCSGDDYIMSRVDKSANRSTAHLPYEILVSDDTAYALYARFRIAASWPHLPMIQSDTGATFFNIMCAPNAIEEALIQAAGGEV